MSTPIDPTNNAKAVTPPRVASVKPAQSSTESSTPASTNQSASEDTVHLTGDAVQIHQLAASLSRAPAMDMKKVADMRQAISSGKYTVDSRATASKLLAFDSGLGAY